jgi:acyl carrier protein
MMILSLLAFLEENYGIILRKDELKPENFTTLGKINELVIQKIKM